MLAPLSSRPTTTARYQAAGPTEPSCQRSRWGGVRRHGRFGRDLFGRPSRWRWAWVRSPLDWSPALPVMAGGIMQLVSLRAVRWIGSEKRWIVLCASLQALVVCSAGLRGADRFDIAPWMLFLVASIYWGTGLATGPAWSTWIETVVPAGIRMRYFARSQSPCPVDHPLGFPAWRGGLDDRATPGRGTHGLWP